MTFALRFRIRTLLFSVVLLVGLQLIPVPCAADYLMETAMQFRFATNEITTLDVEDVTGDGIADLVGVCENCEYSGENWLVVRPGLGDGTFGERVVSDISGVGGYARRRFIAHLDSDQHLDLVILNEAPAESGSFNVLLGAGDGSFSLSTGYTTSWTYAIEVADFTGDGVNDVALGEDSYIHLHVNQGDGTFTEGAATAVNLGEIRSLVAGDFDEDGDIDLAAGTNNQYPDYYVSILLNDGSGSFAPQPEMSHGAIWRLATADMNGDGHLDLMGGDLEYPAVRTLSFGNGDGSFGTFENIWLDPSPESTGIGDVDGDGDLDVVGNTGYPSYGEITTFLNDGSGAFENMGFCFGWGQQVVLEDLDGDGALDAVMLVTESHEDNQYAATLLGRGDGTFHSVDPYLREGFELTRLIVDDFNDDGKPDLVWCDQYSSIQDRAVWVALNIHPNGFQETEVQLPGINTWNLASGDLDGDGVNDILVIDKEIHGVHVLLNNGDGTFQAPVTYGTGFNPEAAALGDLDGDGDVDAAVMHETAAQLGIMLNNGDGTLVAPLYYDATRRATDIILRDLDGDGDLDVATDEMESAGGNVVVVKNNGDGSFAPPQLYDAVDPRGIAADDFDGDGDLDLATGSGGDGFVSALLNNGDGTFGDAVATETELDNGRRFAAADMNLDGTPDLVQLGVTSHSLVIVPGNGDGSFSSPKHFTVGWEAPDMGLGDFDGDGDIEPVLGEWRTGVFVVTNNAAQLNPTGLLVTGPGPGAYNPTLVRVFPVAAGRSYTEWHAYGADRWGVNVALGELDGTEGPEVLTGAGPGPIFGPHVRGFQDDGTPLPGVSFLTYGTNKWGVNVCSGDLDADGFDEIVTGAGPGEVFGPHVRGWNWDGSGTPTPIPGISYFAYGTPKWGVNVSCGDIDGDGYDEIVTGAGPGAVYGPHVRGWNCDGSGAAAISAVSFLAYGTNKYGVNVSCGDIDGDGIDEIVTGAGPGEVFGPHVRAWNWDGSGTVQTIGAVSFFAYNYTRWGANVSCGDLDGDGIDEIITGPGPGETHLPRVRGWNYDGQALTALSGIDFYAYDTTAVNRGVKVGGLRN